MKPLGGFDLIRPRTIAGVLEIMSSLETAQVIAGGTDMIPVFRDIGCKPEHLIELTTVQELNGIFEEKENILIGPTTTHTQLLESNIVKEKLSALWEGCSVLGSVQIRNRGTIGGNICNASPAADTAPGLIVHGTELHIGSLREIKWVPIENFFVGPKITILNPNEIVIGFRIPIPPENSGSAFQRIGRRNGFCLSIVNCATYLERDGQKVNESRIALGSVGPTPMRIVDAEKVIKGKKFDEKMIAEAAAICMETIKPIDDIRGSADYRKDMTAVLVKRTLSTAWRRTGGAF